MRLQAVLLEMLLTLFLMFVVCAVATDVRAVGQAVAIVICGYVALAATFAGPVAALGALLYGYVREARPLKPVRA